MELRWTTRVRPWALFVGVALTAWAAAGVVWAPVVSPEVLFEPDYTIRYVPAGGVLAEAGFQPGDSVVSVEGIPVSRLGMYSRWPRSLARRPGESITMVADRGGVRVSGEIRYRPAPPGAPSRLIVADVVGLVSVWLGIWSLLVAPSAHAARFAALGITFGFLLPGPDLGTVNGVRDDVQIAAVVLWALLFLRFFLFFPRRKVRLTGRWATAAMAGPWFVLVACLGLELAFHPRFYHTFGPLYGLLVTAYPLLALAAVIHTLVTTPREVIRASGMTVVLWGFGIGVVGVAGWIAAAAISGFSIPGAWLLPLTLVAIPIGMTVAVRRDASGRRLLRG
jgi:hypothetical protein